ncbi:MAG: hypothetical protein KDC61_23875 [Saprospiraceae bacterium]|nr:hypothetical protein [Saprospiraceae bacterium]
MNSNKRKTWKINWNVITTLLSSIGLILAASGLFYTAKQIELSRKIAKSEFLREFYISIQDYNEIQIKLAEHGEWRQTNVSGPENEKDWFLLQRYMGLLEQVDNWYIDGIMEIKYIDNSYSHRIKAIYTHPIIRERLLVKESYRWQQFLHLIDILKKEPTFSKLEYTYPTE